MIIAGDFENAETFLAWAEGQAWRYELVDGVVQAMAGSSTNHARPHALPLPAA
jgi:hypothetical protein